MSTSLASATAVVAIPTALLIGGAAVASALVSALITWGLVADSDLMDTVEELCEGRERACLAKLQLGRKKRSLADLPLISRDIRQCQRSCKFGCAPISHLSEMDKQRHEAVARILNFLKPYSFQVEKWHEVPFLSRYSQHSKCSS
ncbi:hypothetical protein QR680_007625 [Steinernema hermaphroditum]|uniref:Uncharacterized protein n=1 Tax=Steinernema hermaphroditum TaxID=289476 RepID=A0AA39IDR4_9BILA|nr:hypothetical protein QR680_007625 [Steinernema hermaphroditum]